MKIYFSTRQVTRDFAATLQSKGKPAKVVDGQAKQQLSVKGTRFAVDLKPA